MGYVKGV